MSKKGVADYADTIASSSPNFDSALSQADSPSPSPTSQDTTALQQQGTQMSAVHPAPPETTTPVSTHPVSLHPLPPVNVSLHHHHHSSESAHVASPSAASSSVPQLPPVHAHHHHHHTGNHSSSLALAAATGSRPSSRPQSARDRDADGHHGDIRLGHGPAAFDNDGRHSFRAKAIPLVGKDVSARTGIGAVDLAAGLLHHLHNNNEGGSRRTSLQKPDAHQQQQPASGRRPGTGPGPAEGPDSARGLRRMDSTGKRGSGGPLSGRRSSNDKHKMIPLGRVGTIRSMAKSEDGEMMAATKSQHGSRAVSKIGRRSGQSSGRSSRLGDGEEGDDQKPQEIEGLDEFDAKQREEIKIGMAKRRQTIAVTGKDVEDEENIDEGDLAVREAIEAKKLQKKQISPIGQAIMDWLDGGWGTLIMTIATIFCLFGDDIRVMGVPKSGDLAFVILSSIFFGLFGFEFLSFCFWREQYNLSFFFFLDLIAVFSLITDMTYIWDPFMTAIGQSDAQNQNLAVARASRASRAGTRAGRLVRFIRLVRFLRVVKLYKICGETEEERLKREEEEKAEELERIRREAEEKLIAEMDSEIGKGFSDYITKCVIVMVLFMMFLLPLLEVSETDSTSIFFIQQLDVVLDPTNGALVLPTHEVLNTLFNQYYQQFGNDVLVFAYNDTVLSGGAMAGNIVYLSDNTDKIDSTLRSNEISQVAGQFALSIVSIKQSVVEAAAFSFGTTIFVTILLAGGAALFSKDANDMVIFPIERMFLFVTKLAANPLGKIQPSGDANQPYETRLLETTFLKLAGLLQIGFGAAGAEVISHNMKGDYLDPMVPGRKIFAIFGFCDIRKFGVVTEALGQHVMVFCNQVADIVHEITHTYGGAANKNIGNAFLLVWKPTVATIRKMSLMKEMNMAAQLAKYSGPTTHTIAEDDIAEEGEEDDSSNTNTDESDLKSLKNSQRNGQLGQNGHAANAQPPVSPVAEESKEAEKWAQRTPHKNELKDVTSMPAVQASTNTTEAHLNSLSEKRKAALALVEHKPQQENDINTPASEVTVASLTASQKARKAAAQAGASQRKPSMSLQETKTGPMWDALKHLADQSVVAFLSTIKQVAIAQELAHWRSNDLMKKLLGNPPGVEYEVDMGFGLHVGWAIEGAIGSIYKIDASYLSPNVNIASRLCGATKQYGVRILISGPLHSLLQPEIQRRCRHLDCITVKGSKLPLDIFTFDVGHLALKSPAVAAALKASEKGSHAIDMPKHKGISLTSAGLVHKGEDDLASAADIITDDDGNPVQPLTIAKSQDELIDEAVEARKKRRGSGGAGAGHLLSNGAKVLSSIAGVFKKDAAPAQNSVSPAPMPPAPFANRIHPEEKSNNDSAAPAAAVVEMTPTKPAPPTINPALGPTSPPSLTSPKTPKVKVESGEFTSSALLNICAQLQLGLGEDFVRVFNEASSQYIKGHWGKARDILENKFLKAYPNDKPAKVLLGIMAENNFHKPSDWKGYRKLTSK